MKTTSFKPSGIARLTACIVATVGLGVASASAASSVSVSLDGQAFGSGTTLNVTSTRKLSPATAYQYKIVGTCHSTGDFAGIIPNGTSIKDLFKRKLRTGTISNPEGTRTFTAINNKPFSITETISTPLPIDVTLSAIVHAGATDGVVFLNITGFAIDPVLPVNGTIVFEPGSKLVISVVP